VVLNRHEYFLHHPHQGSVFGRQDIKHLREFLANAGASLSAYEAKREAAKNSG
jgi:hypothetical protein